MSEMRANAINLLELNKIIAMLASFAGSDMAKRRIMELTPLRNERMVREAITETTEGVSVIAYKGSMPIGEMSDISGMLKMARKGMTLSMRDLLTLRTDLAVFRELKTFLMEDMPETKSVAEMARLIENVPNLENDIERSILSENELADNASPKLKNIRREIRFKNEAIRGRLAQYSSSGAKYLQEAIVTVRNGRYVLPVKKEYLRLVPGIIHDRSRGGATVFVEPQTIVNMNNELRELQLMEETETERILAELSSRAAEHYFVIMNDLELATKLDFINAKSKLSISMDAVPPELNTAGRLKLKNARHPLIEQNKVIPIDVELGGEFNTLLITGPNTGGKTVTLKTIGLMVLMTECGLHIPCSQGSEVPLFEEVFADIGDEQSIEQSLSTFSSHISKINKVLRIAKKGSLVLLDELGAGTDPAEGAALGIAILERLKNNGAAVAATTHYTELKKYAIEESGVENASMEFDIETLSPTYRLRLGIPGKSNAFEIARRLGADDKLIARATELLDANELSFDNAVSAVEEDRKKIEGELSEAKDIRLSAEADRKKAAEELAAAKAKRISIEDEAREEARRIIYDAGTEADDIISKLKKSTASESAGERTRAISAARNRLRSIEKDNKASTANLKRNSGKSLTTEEICVGMRVKIAEIGQNGVVETMPDDSGNMSVRVGAIKMNVHFDDLMSIESQPEGNKAKKKHSYSKLYGRKAQSISLEINVIGENLDDALADVEKYLDDAALAGVKRVTIVHGRGAGILKEGIRSAIGRNDHVKSFERAPYNDGGEGATVVYMKE